MRPLVFLLPCCALSFLSECAAAEPFMPTAPEGTRWVLKWNDEFEGEKLDEYVRVYELSSEAKSSGN